MTKTLPLNQLLPNLPVSFRPISAGDQELLRRIYASTREEELAQVPWSAEQKAAFLTMQFNAQHQHYQQHFKTAAFELVLLDGAPAGRLYLDHRQDELRIIDIALLPAYRGRGLGTAILTAVLERARSLGLPVRIHVEQYNPALRLYSRLGFRSIDLNGIYYLMEWVPNHGQSSSTDSR